MPRQDTKPRDNLHVPPHDEEAEKSVLGALLIDKDSIVKVIEFLRPHHFYREANANVYQAIMNLFERREPADLVTVPAELRAANVLEKTGGVTYLTELVTSVPTAANIESYARIIKDAATKRSLITSAAKIHEMVFTEGNISAMLDRAEQLLYSISTDNVKQDFVGIKEILEITFERLDELSKNKGELRGVPTGLKTLDRLLSGLQKDNLIILAARTSVGKSSIMLNIAQHAATTNKSGVVIFSLEMGRESMVDRMTASQAGIDSWRISTGNLEQEDFEKYGIAAGELAEAPIFIDDTAGISVLEMRTKVRRLMLDHKIDLIIVDYLQLVKAEAAESRVQEVAAISRGLKQLAKELRVPVLAAAQLSRAVEQRGTDRRPQLSDLRESGSIEQDADAVIFLYRPNEEERNNVKLLIAKHRNGPTGEIDLYFKAEYTKFYEVDKRD